MFACYCALPENIGIGIGFGIERLPPEHGTLPCVKGAATLPTPIQTVDKASATFYDRRLSITF